MPICQRVILYGNSVDVEVGLRLAALGDRHPPRSPCTFGTLTRAHARDVPMRPVAKNKMSLRCRRRTLRGAEPNTLTEGLSAKSASSSQAGVTGMPLTSGVDTAAVQAGLPSYVVHGELDAGGYGVTFDAEHGGSRLAVKVLDIQSHEAAMRTPLEIDALRSINHPNVVRMVDEGFLDTLTDPNRYRYIACEFVEGSNLQTLAQGGHRFTIDEVRSIGRDTAAGVQAVHDAKLVHRDVKPKNVMYNTTTGNAVLLDVGIAKHLDVTPVTVGLAPGSYGWKSPEHLLGQAVDRRADVYSLGLLLYWLASGKHPFEDKAAAHGGDLEAAMLAGQFEPAGVAQPGLPPDAANIIDRMLSLQPYDRPRRASDVIACLS